jgi:hypothetical protein
MQVRAPPLIVLCLGERSGTQNYFLLDPYPVPGGIDLIPAQIASVRAARQAGMPVIWLNVCG